MQIKGKRVLVTGAGGFIGSHLVERLVELGAQVRALVHYNSNGTWGWLDYSKFKEEVEVVSGDICDRDSVMSAMRDCEGVFHLAALIAIPYSYESPASYVRTNIEGTLNVLQAARQVGVSRLIQTSTSEVYGTARSVPIDESHGLRGQSPYAASKIGADKLAESFHLSFGLPIVTVRPFNTYGPRQSARAVIPTIISQCFVSESVKLGNLNPTRDLSYVGNTVEGFVRSMEIEEALGLTINIGSGEEISIGDLAETIAKISGRSIVIERQEERVRPKESEVERLVADNRLAREVLDWTPKVSLEQGLELTVQWVREHLDKYRPGGYVV